MLFMQTQFSRPSCDMQIYAPSQAKMDAACAAVRAVEGTDLVEGQVYPAQVGMCFQA